MNFEVGSIVEGKVTGIKPFGAFVALNDEVQGLVHISEVSHSFVKDINDVLKVGDIVQVKILSVDEDSKRFLFPSVKLRKHQPKLLKKNVVRHLRSKRLKILPKASTHLKQSLKNG